MKMSQWRRAVKNRCVFSARLKVLSDRFGDISSGGRRFHVAVPLTGPDTDSGSLVDFPHRCVIEDIKRFIGISHTVTGQFFHDTQQNN